MAETSHSSKDSVTSKSSTGTFFHGPDRPAFFSQNVIQRKCKDCEEEEKMHTGTIQRQDAGGSSSLPPESPQAPAGKDLGTPFVQFKLTVNPPGDRYEKEADSMADRVVQRQSASVNLVAPGTSGIQAKCDHCEGQEKKLQRKGDGQAGTGSGLEATLNNAQGQGQSLSPQVNAEMSDAFGADFSQVRIHTDGRAAQLSKELNAHAFTYGKDVYFNAGQYNTSSTAGRHLLAHELTHVVQQNPGTVQRKAESARHTPAIREGKPVVQRSYYFGSVPNIGGTAIHATVLPAFAKNNPDLFTEVSIPGATKTDVDKGKAGSADFYKASKTIGIRFDGAPEYLKRDKDFVAGNAGYNHNKDAAPMGGKHTPRVRQLDVAPVKIEIGDLKPGGAAFSAEAILGPGQVANYKSGISATARDVNSYLSAHPAEGDSKTKKSWDPVPIDMMSLTVPPELRIHGSPGLRGLRNMPLAVYKNGTKFSENAEGLKGTLRVYPDGSGIWSYEWIPDEIRPSLGSGPVDNILTRLNQQVIPHLTALSATAAGGTVQPKVMRKSQAPFENQVPGKDQADNVDHPSVQRQLDPAPVTPIGKPSIQREENKFDDENWKQQYYNPWKTDAEKFLGNKPGVQQAQIAQAIVEVNDRTGGHMPVPGEVKERGEGLTKITHWKTFGGLYGWLRAKFDWIYVKISGFANKIKAKVKSLLKKASGSSFGSWFKAAAQVIFKIFKMVGSWVVTQVLDQLVNSLRQGITNNLKKLADAYTPENVKSKIEEFNDLKQQYEEMVTQKEEQLSDWLFGDKMALFDAVENIENLVGDVSTIVTIVEWGLRLLACASPPAIGCLWNLAMSALEAVFGLLMQTCWFTKKVYGPIISNIDMVKNFPVEIAAKVAEGINKYLPVPQGYDPWFAPITINTDEFKPDCDEGGSGASSLTPDREAIMDVAQQIGDNKLYAILYFMKKRGAGPWVLLDASRMAAAMQALGSMSTEDLHALADDPKREVPEQAKPFLQDISKYTPKENQLKDKAAEAARQKAEAAKAKAAAAGQVKGESAGKIKEGGGNKAKGAADNTGGGQPSGSKGGLVVLDASQCIPDGRPTPVPAADGMSIFVVNPSQEDARRNPGIISVDIYAGNRHVYRVNRAVVKEVKTAWLLSIPTVYEVVYFLTDGIQVEIEGKDYKWSYIEWSHF